MQNIQTSLNLKSLSLVHTTSESDVASDALCRLSLKVISPENLFTEVAFARCGRWFICLNFLHVKNAGFHLSFVYVD